MKTLRLETVSPPYPQLPEALGSLDVTLDSELAFYRQHRQQQGQAALLPQSLPSDAVSSDADLQVSAGSELSELLVDVRPSTENGAKQSAIAEDTVDRSSRPTSDEHWGEDQDARQLDAMTETAFEKTDSAKTDSAKTKGSKNTKEPRKTDTTSADASLDPLEAAVAGGSAQHSTVAANAPLESYLDPAIEDYLESSEALLKHLETDDVPVLHDELPAPWTGYRWVLAMGLGLVLGGLVFWHYTRQQPSEPDPDLETPATPEETSEPVPSGAVPSAPTVTVSEPANAAPTEATRSNLSAPSGPNLANQSFPDLNLSNLGQLDPQAEAVANGLEEPGLFFVVVEEGESVSLEAARTLVPEAFDNGREIQLGAIEGEAAAQRLAERLRSQGLPARVVAN